MTPADRALLAEIREREMPAKFDLYVYEVDGHDDLDELGDVLRAWARPRGRRFSLMRSMPVPPVQDGPRGQAIVGAIQQSPIADGEVSPR